MGDAAESLSSYLKAALYLNRMGFLKKALAVYKMTLRYDPDNDEAIHAANTLMMETVLESLAGPGPGPFIEPEGTVPLGFLSHFTSDEIGEILRSVELKKVF